ncbi:hypothetical protein I552_4877 [Mycobacterium xenopi 3993]|nr:hypothetical protein I552_4877 [Mycobacterium xenopi 3993]
MSAELISGGRAAKSKNIFSRSCLLNPVAHRDYRTPLAGSIF